MTATSTLHTRSTARDQKFDISGGRKTGGPGEKNVRGKDENQLKTIFTFTWPNPEIKPGL